MRTNGYNKRSKPLLRFERYLSYHWWLLWRTGVETGLRVSDLLQISTENLKKTMEITERKTGKVRTVTIPKQLFDELKRFSSKTWVWQSPRTGKPYTRQAAWKAFSLAAERAKLGGRMGTHSMRKTFARAQKMPPEELQKVFGHDYVSTTLLYLFF